MRRALWTLPVLALLLTGSTGVPPAPPSATGETPVLRDPGAIRRVADPAGGRSTSWDDYRLILSRNIFARDRTGYSRAARTYSSAPSAPRGPENFLVLTGIGLQGSEQMAFFEDTRDGQTVRAGAGQTVGGVRLSDVTLDGVTCLTPGGPRQVAIGENLVGLAWPPYMGPVAEPSTAPTSQPGATSGPTTQAADTQPGAVSPAPVSGSSIEEQMRLRRLRELR